MLSTHSSLTSCLGYHTDCRAIAELVFKSPPFCLLVAPKRKNSDARNLHMLKRSWKVKFTFQVKGKFSQLYKERKNSCPEVVKVWAKNQSSICEIVRKDIVCPPDTLGFGFFKLLSLHNKLVPSHGSSLHFQTSRPLDSWKVFPPVWYCCVGLRVIHSLCQCSADAGLVARWREIVLYPSCLGHLCQDPDFRGFVGWGFTLFPEPHAVSI